MILLSFHMPGVFSGGSTLRICYFCQRMHSFAAILLALLFTLQSVTPNMDLCCELQKLPNLIEHYQEHAQLDDAASWFTFLELHYGSGQSSREHHSDEHDGELPFQGKHHCSHAPVCYSLQHESSLAIVLNFATESGFGHYTASFTSEYPDTPFQPPRA